MPCYPHSHTRISRHRLSSDTAPTTTDIYTLSLHDALPICDGTAVDPHHVQHLVDHDPDPVPLDVQHHHPDLVGQLGRDREPRSEEHTSELQSPCNLVCRLLLEKKKSTNKKTNMRYANLSLN